MDLHDNDINDGNNTNDMNDTNDNDNNDAGHLALQTKYLPIRWICLDNRDRDPPPHAHTFVPILLLLVIAIFLQLQSNIHAYNTVVLLKVCYVPNQNTFFPVHIVYDTCKQESSNFNTIK